MSDEMLLQLYDEIKQCTSCSLSDLDINSFRISSKLGRKKVMIISQNPSYVKTKDSIIMGGLDKLRSDELNKLLDECYITNLVKCSFENNKIPFNIDSIMNHCTWLWKEIEIIDPRVIIVLGRLAKDQFLKRLVHYSNRRIIYMKHPLYHVYKGTSKEYTNNIITILRNELK